jgi:AcrR family transcriptional regulator
MARNSKDTRDRLLEAARLQFAEHGFERSTVRAIASAAKVDPALINRYFGGKEQLFAEAVSIDLAFPDLGDTPRDRIGEALAHHFFKRWEGDPSDDLLRVLIRSAATNEEAALRIRHIFEEQVAMMVARLTGAADSRQRAALVATQILGLAYCRYVLRLDERDLPADEAARSVGATLQRYLFEGLSG